ncbi:hypothetical protein F66182_3109 [Fusarium sp. NRRL 66182]|nr:hypothetical protein F66182_3109 [Fusarium sp. NRRL 66182]
MAWFKEFVVKAGEVVDRECQRRQQQQQQQQQHQQGYSGQRTYQTGQYGQMGGWQQQPIQYQRPQPTQYHQPQQQYQHVPPPLPYRPVSSQPEAHTPAQNEPRYAVAEAQRTWSEPHMPQTGPRQTGSELTNARAESQALGAHADQEIAHAKADLEALRAQNEIQMAQARAQIQAATQKETYSQRDKTLQLESQWREAERLAARYKAEYEAQMKKAEEDLAKMRIDGEEQREELGRLRTEDVRLYQLGEDDVIKEQQRLLDEIQRQRERPGLPPRVNTDVEGVAPPLPRRPVSTVGGVSPGPQRRESCYTPWSSQRDSYLIPQSPSQGHIPRPPPGPPPGQAASPAQGLSNAYSPHTPGQSFQQTHHHHHPPPSTPIQSQQYDSPVIQQGQRDSYHSPGPASSQQGLQQQPVYYSPPTWSSESPQQPPPSRSTQQPKTALSKPPRTRTPEPANQHACGAKAGAECSASLTSFPQHWFYHPAVPEFVLCARCYVDNIYDTQLRDSFRKVYYDDGQKRRCRFSTKRIKEMLFPAAVESGSLDDLIEFMRKRMTIRDCREQTAVQGESWYATPDIPNGTICQACFEDTLVVSPFAKHYHLEQSQEANCDMSIWFVKRTFWDYDNWASFCSDFRERVTLPPCPKMNTIKANDGAWYKPKNGPGSLQACVACYHDYFYASEDEDRWEQVRRGDFETRCSMGQLNHVIPMHQALEDEDRSVFWKAVVEMDKFPFCHQKGTKGGVWYIPLNDPDNWGICAACYEGIVKPVGGSRWFMRDKSIQQDGVYLCGFNLGHVRAQQGLEAYSNAHNWGQGRLLLDWAAQWGHIQQCPRAKIGPGNRRWWGWGVVAICEECYTWFAKGTALEARFALTGAREDKERMCDLFSPRMRGLYTQACETGDLQSLVAFAEQRHIIYTQTMMQCEQILQQQQMAALQANTLGIQGTFYKSMGMAVDATMGHAYTVGNAYAGYGHANEWVLQGHVYDGQSREAAMGAMSGGPTMQIGLLEARWREVE